MGRRDPLKNFRFRVEIADIEAGGFSEVSGLEITTDAIDYRNGNEVSNLRKLPGMTRYGNVTLKRGLSDSMALYDWHREVVDGELQRRTVVVILLDEKRQDRARFEIIEAWPCRYEASTLDGEGNAVAIETVELCNEGIRRLQ